MLSRITTLSFLSFLLFSCGTRKNEQTTEVEPAIETATDKGEEEKEPEGTVLIVNSYQGERQGDPERKLYLLTQEGNKSNGQWEYNYTAIEGFDYEPGYVYKIRVVSVMDQGMPQPKLVEQYSKEIDKNYFRLHNIWALTHLDGKEIEVVDKRPNLEINLTSMKVSGSGTCNQLFGKVEMYTAAELVFGPMGSTKKMCDQLTLEKAFLSGLSATRYYRISEGFLTLMDENKTEVVRLKNVD